MSFKKFLQSRTFIIHLILAVILLIGILFLVMQGLKSYTRHGQSEPVPDFSGFTPEEVVKTARQNNLRVRIIDSLYVDDADPGVIVDQVPEPGHGVKENRTVFLTINATQPELVTIPQLTDISFRQAQVMIENSGLRIGQVSYEPSEYVNLVLNVMVDSVEIDPEEKLPRGTSIDLVVGREQGNMETSLPNLTGFKVDEARAALNDARLNAGVLIYDESVTDRQDSLDARVWRQRPNPRGSVSIPVGSLVDLWVTVEETKLEDAFDEER